jgi:hypothetical protein
MRMIAKQLTVAFALAIFTLPAFSQKEKINFYRPYDQRGIGMFETDKTDTIEFTGLKVRIGGNS